MAEGFAAGDDRLNSVANPALTSPIPTSPGTQGSDLPTTASSRKSVVIVSGYTWLVGAATLGCTAAIAALGPPNQHASAIIMLIAVAFIGLPHGAYDLEIARRLLPRHLGRAWWLWFGAAYLGLVCLGLALWLIAPWVGLVTLLIGGALHWGADDLEVTTPRRWIHFWLAASRGAIPVATPMLFASANVAEIFRALVFDAPVSGETVQILGGAWLVLASPGIAVQLRQATRMSIWTGLRALFELCVLLAWLAVAPPVLAFTLYFCFWHSVRHSMRTALSSYKALPMRTAAACYLRAVILPTVLTWGIGSAAFFFFDNAAVSTDRVWQLVFVGLFALTVPHVILELLRSHGDLPPRLSPESM